MKTEDLKAKGLSEEQIAYVMAENGKEVNAAKGDIEAATTAKTQLQQQLDAANQKLEGYDPAWAEKAKKAKEDAENAVKQVRYDAAIDAALRDAGARNPKAVKALLSHDALKLSDDNKIIGLSEQLESIKKDNDYMFESTKKPPAVTTVTNTGTPATTDEAYLQNKYKDNPFFKK